MTAILGAHVSENSRRSFWWPLALGLVTLFCVLVVYRGGDGLAQAQAELDSVRAANERLAAENRALYRQAQRLREDASAIERAARLEMGLIRPDEIVYQRSKATGE